MNSEIPPPERSLSRFVAIVSGVYVVACIPAILLLERLERSQWFLHVTQLAAIVICTMASISYLLTRRQERSRAFSYLAIAASLVGLGWIVFALFMLFTRVG